MRLKRKLTKIVIISALLATLGIIAGPTSLVSAQNPCLPNNPLCTPAGGNAGGGSTNTPSNTTFGNDCTASNNNLEACVHKNPLVNRLREIINFLAAGVGVVVVFGIIVGGIQYITAGDNPTKVQAARQRILNAILALIAFGLAYAFLQYLIPGGLFNP